MRGPNRLSVKYLVLSHLTAHDKRPKSSRSAKAQIRKSRQIARAKLSSSPFGNKKILHAKTPLKGTSTIFFSHFHIFSVYLSLYLCKKIICSFKALEKKSKFVLIFFFLFFDVYVLKKCHGICVRNG